MVNLKHHKLVKVCNDHISNLSINKFLIAYSGGMDSSVLLDCFFKLSQIIPIKIRSIHINHGLSEETDLFEDHCEKICKEYGINHITEKLNLKLTSNIEEQCRKERYRKLCENCEDDEAIITAHHEEDQIETFFLRLIRGSGARGLSCMKETSVYDKSLLSRPFLKIPKEEIKKYSENNGVKYIEDISNNDNKYDRNFLRNELIPLLKSRWPSVNKNIINNILVHDIQSAYTTDSVNSILPGFLGASNNKLLIDTLIDKPFHLKVIILHEWVYLESKTLLNLKQIKEIIKIINTNNDSNPLFAFGNIKIRKTRNILSLSLNES
jgi:tRNA(Ile)-lysidine synthase